MGSGEGDDDVVVVVVVVAQGFAAAPTAEEPVENVLGLTACVTRGGSNRENFVVGEAEINEGEADERGGEAVLRG